MPFETEAKERRVHDRRPCDLFVFCYPLSFSGNVQWSGRIIDMSCGGLRMVVSRWFEEGTILKIHAEGLAEEVPLTMLGRVLHVSPYVDGGWSLGCHVTPNVEEKDLEAMLQECLR
jgi:PilZ domain